MIALVKREFCLYREQASASRALDSAVLITSVTDAVKALAPASDWLKDIQDHARRKGLDKLAIDDIDAEIAAARRERREQRPSGR